MPHKEFIRDVQNGDTVVLFIHGILGTPAHFSDFLNIVPNNFAIYNMLLDGHGKKPEDFSRTSMKKWKEQVNSTVESLSARYENIIIVAHSMGTLFAVNEGIKYKDSVKALFLLAIPLSVNVKPTAVKNSLKIIFDKTDEDDEVLQAMKDGCSIDIDKRLWNYLAWTPRYAELLNEISNTKEILPILDIPCIIFQSKGDELVSLKSLSFFKTNPEITCFLLENSGHFYYNTHDKQIMLNEFGGLIQKFENK